MWERPLFFDHRAFLPFMWVEAALLLVVIAPLSLSIVIRTALLCEGTRDAQLCEPLGNVTLRQVRLRIGVGDGLALGHGLHPHP